MIVYLDKTIGEHCDSHELSDTETILFTELATAYQRGRCLLCGDLFSIEKLMRALPGTTNSIYKKVRNRSSEIRSIIEKVETLIVLSYKDNPSVPDFIEKKFKLIKIDNAVNYNLNEQCTLIAENLDDCRFYRILAKRYMSLQQIKGVKISFHDELGGGNTINKVFEKCVTEDNVLILCIVDSDIKHGTTKKFPNKPSQGTTATTLEKTYRKLVKIIPPNTYELYCLPVHEVENLIPLSILEQISQKDLPDMKIGLNILQRLKKSKCEQAILYYDFKNGYSQAASQPLTEYWSEIGSRINETSFPCLSSKLMGRALILMEADYADIQIDEYLQSIWNAIGLKTFTWGCANQPIRA